mmetsp:Transcript_34543/g.59214  ORF Transcript_34543/g.59214 Transcript_34543/m.59214 type:complete len:328 (+) Transcript_34543:46-1029(+)
MNTTMNTTPLPQFNYTATSPHHHGLRCSNEIFMLPLFDLPPVTENQSSSFSPKNPSVRSPHKNNDFKNFSFYFNEDKYTNVELCDDEDDDEDDIDSYAYLYDEGILDSDTESEFEYVSCSESTFDSFDNCYDDENILEKENCSCDPFWFNNEEPEHIEVIFDEYTNNLISSDEFMRSVQPFVGRIERVNASSDSSVFQTFDRVTIGNCQRVPYDKALPIIREEYCLTTWDCDGIPCKILKLTPKQINFWSNKLCDTPSSFLYRKPDFTQLKEAKDSKFQLSSSCHFEELTYSGLPNTGAFSPFVRSSSFSLPSHLADETDFEGIESF